MKAITIWPEWCWAILRLGKNIENRTWKPPRSVAVGDQIAIHAGVAFGGAGPFANISRVFDPVAEMARRDGWRLGIEKAKNAVVGFSIRTPDTFEAPVHWMARGAVVAVVRFRGVLSPVRCTVDHVERYPWWAEDQYGWLFDDVVALAKPVKCRGRQGLWNLPPCVEESVLMGVEAARRKAKVTTCK